MKQILPKLKEVNKHLSFAKTAFSKQGFRHFTQYVDGLIALNKKTIKQISKASLEENHHSAISRLLSSALFKQERLEERYLKKVAYYAKGQETSLIFDDTLVKREGKLVEGTQRHKNHSGNEDFITGHQFFTSIVSTALLQLPLFPRLYSKYTDSKIQMALDLIDYVAARMRIDTVLMDSWYSDRKILKRCMAQGIRVVTIIKTNRKISFETGIWQQLSTFKIPDTGYTPYLIDEKEYLLAEFKVKLNRTPYVKMIVSKQKEKKEFKKAVHLISTEKKDTPAQIIRRYEQRWVIETYHWDIKQNLGFAKLFLRKKEGIVRHSIFVTIAYAVLKLFVFMRGINMTLGETIAEIQERTMDDFVLEIIEIEDKSERMNKFREVYLRESAKV